MIMDNIMDFQEREEFMKKARELHTKTGFLFVPSADEEAVYLIADERIIGATPLTPSPMEALNHLIVWWWHLCDLTDKDWH